MASTTIAATRLTVVGQNFAGARVLTFGVATLAGGTVNVDTGLTTVDAMICNGVSGTNTEGCTFTIMEDLPCVGSAVTVDGTKIDEGAATADSNVQQFCWFAFGTL